MSRVGSFPISAEDSTNLSLIPERIRGLELVVEHRFREAYYVSGAAFLNRIDDLIEQNLDPLTRDPIYTNSGPVRTKGIELALIGKRPNGLDGSISYTLQDSRSVGTDDILPSSPKQLVQADLSVPLVRKDSFASVDAQYVSGRRTIGQTDLGVFLP